MSFDNVKHTITCVAIAFTDGEKDLDSLYEKASDRIAEIITTLETPKYIENIKNGVHGLVLKTVIDEEEFRQNVEKTKEYIRCGDIIQSVISQKFTCEAPHDLTALYRAQRYINPSPYMYFMHMGILFWSARHLKQW
jgi:anthranilate synthase component 1